MTDVSVIDDGTLVTIIPVSNAAKKVFRHLIAEPFQIRPDGSIILDAWGARDLIEDLRERELAIEGADELLH